MKIDLIQQNPVELVTSCLMVGLYENGKLSETAQAIDNVSHQAISNIIKRGDFTAEVGQTLMLHHITGIKAERVLLVGFGCPDDLNTQVFYKAVQAAFTTLVKLPVTNSACFLGEITFPQSSAASRARTLAQLAEMANYKFDEFKSKKSAKTHLLATLNIVADNSTEPAIQEGQAIAHGINLARHLANMPCNICTPAYLAEQAKMLAAEFSDIEVKVLEKAGMAALKMGAFLAVAQGSHNPPKLIELHYQGGAADLAPIVLVGKGITFDTGGISLKPAGGMEDMKFDMAGAASVIGTLRAVAELKLPINVIGLVPTAENMPDGNAYRPGDIVTSMSGQTIEIVNTDAEGRLLLCDALTYAERFKPQTVIDIATLTGAMVVSLGYLLNGIFSNQDDLAHELVAAGKKSNDLAWHMPLIEEYQEGIKSNYADMINASKLAGAITAACFLSRYTKAYRWAHIDCAGTAMPADNNKAAGATGRPVALLVEYLLHVSTR